MHDHPHAPGTTLGDGGRRALLLSLGLNGAFLGVEVAVGSWTGSLALLSDAAHMVGDVGALLLALLAARLASLAARPSRTFGLRRAEVLGAFLNALLMVGIVGGIVWEAIDRLRAHPSDVPGMPVLVVGGVGLLINLLSAYWLYRSSRQAAGNLDNLNLRGALLHMLADALGSVGAMLAALLILLGFPSADALVSLFTAALVLWGSWSLLVQSTRVLLELPPTNLDVREVQRSVEETPQVVSVHDLHVWSLAGGEAILTAHVLLAAGANPSLVQELLLDTLASRFEIHHATLQLEDGEGRPCDGRDCGGQARATA